MTRRNLRNVDLNLLVVFNALIEEKHITNAANRLNMSQSAMSKALVRLQETLKDQVLVRMPTGYELTSRAKELANPVAHILSDLEKIMKPDFFDPSTTTNEYVIGALDYAEIMVGAALMRRITQNAPNSKVTFVNRTPRTIEDLVHGHVDMTLGAAPKDDPENCTVQPLFDGKLVCVMDKDHPIANKTITLEDYLSYPHAILQTGLAKLPVDTALGEIGKARNVVKESPNFVASVMSLKNTSMILSLPRIAVMPVLNASGLVMHDLPFDVSPIKFSMIWHKRNNENSSQMWFREQVKNAVDDILDAENTALVNQS